MQNEKIFIQNLPKLCENLELLTHYDLCLKSETEMIYLLAQKLNDLMVEHRNDKVKIDDKFIKYDDKLRYLLNEGLTNEVRKQLIEMYNNGILQNLVQSAMVDINKKLKENKLLIEKEIKDRETEIIRISEEKTLEINSKISLEKDERIEEDKKLNDKIISNYETSLINQSLSLSSIDDNIVYPLDKMRIKNGWESTYGLNDYPSCKLTKDGVIHFQGTIKRNTENLIILDNMVHILNVFHFPITNEITPVNMRGSVIVYKSNDENSVINLPCRLNPKGELTVKNIDFITSGYTNIDISGLTITLRNYGEDFVDEDIKNICKISGERNKRSRTQLAFFTDLHHNVLRNRSLETIKAINKVNDILNLDFIISGGDNIYEPFNYGVSGRKSALMVHKSIYSSLPKNKFVYCNGNHDSNYLDGNGANLITPNDLKPLFNNVNSIYATDKLYGFSDNYDKKVRIIMFDTHENGGYICDEQINWIKINALDMRNKKDWIVIFVSHVGMLEDVNIVESPMSNSGFIRRLIKDFKNGTGEFSSQGKIEVPLYLFGHTHVDYMIKVDGINFVSTILSWATDSQGVKAFLCTEKELAIDIVSIDEVNRKVYLDRIGRSVSREIDY